MLKEGGGTRVFTYMGVEDAVDAVELHVERRAHGFLFHFQMDPLFEGKITIFGVLTNERRL